MCLLVWQEVYIIFSVVWGKGQIMASLLKMGNDAERFEDHCLIHFFVLANPLPLHVTENKLSETFCGNCICLVVILHCANEVASCPNR